MWKDLFSAILGETAKATARGIIDHGKQRKDGGHDHRTSRGKDRTPAQREADKARKTPK